MTTTLLITKSAEETSVLKEYCSVSGIRLLMHSFIRFERVEAEIPEHIEAIFFGSKRAVDFFPQQSAIPGNCAIACIGEVTQKHLESLGYTVDFTGSKAGDPTAVAKALKSWLGNRKLHIALSEQSNHSMAAVLPAEQVEEIIVYRTLSNPLQLPQEVHMIAFTSPSNVTGFLLENNLLPGTEVIAWGKTTEKALISKNIEVAHVLEHSSEEELVSWLKTR